jgi:hypothetical protein
MRAQTAPARFYAKQYHARPARVRVRGLTRIRVGTRKIATSNAVEDAGGDKWNNRAFSLRYRAGAGNFDPLLRKDNLERRPHLWPWLGRFLPCTEQFKKRGHAVPSSLSETTHGPWH